MDVTGKTPSTPVYCILVLYSSFLLTMLSFAFRALFSPLLTSACLSEAGLRTYTPPPPALRGLSHLLNFQDESIQDASVDIAAGGANVTF